MAGRPLQLDTSAKHGPWSAAIAATVAALAATSITDALESPVWYVPVAANIVGLVAFCMALAKDYSKGAAVWRLLCWMAAGGWSMWVRTHEQELPFGTHKQVWWANAENWYLGVVLVVLGGITAGTMAFRQVRAADRAAAEARRIAQEAMAGNVNDEKARQFRIALAATQGIGSYVEVHDPQTGKPVIDPLTGAKRKVLVGGAKIHGLVPWPEQNGRSHGFTIDGDLPPGKTYEDISNLKSLASWLGLPKGCGVEVDEGNTGRNSFIAKVQTHDAFVHNYPFPWELVKPHSMKDPMPLGVKTDGTIAAINVHRYGTVLAGEPDSGKTGAENEMGVFVATAVDGMLIDFDLSMGMSRPYVEPWFRAQMSGDPERMAAVPAPAIGITCPNKAISWFVSECLIDAVGARKSGHARFMSNMMLKLGRGPAEGGVIELYARVDEGGAYGDGSLLGNLTRQNLGQVWGQGRPALTRGLFGGLRGVDEFIPTNIASLSEHRIILRPTKEREAGLFLGWGELPDIKRAQRPGMSYVKSGTNPPYLQKYYMMGDGTDDFTVEQHVAQIAEKCAPWQPELDQITRDVFNAPRVVDVDEEAIKFFRGKPGVTDNEDGTVTVTNFWENRWDIVLPLMFPDEYESGHVKPQPVPAGAVNATAAKSTMKGSGGMKELGRAARALADDQATLAQNLQDLQAAADEAERRRLAGEPPEYDAAAWDQEADRQRGGQQEEDGAPLDEAEFHAWLNTLPVAAAEPHVPNVAAGEKREVSEAAPTPKRQSLLMLAIIAEAGERGLRVSEIHAQFNTVMERHQGEVSIQTIDKRLKRMAESEWVFQPFGPGPGADPKGRWAITEHGRAKLREQE
ncbi:hypothetical protein [Actinoplanes sp. URMC 104]|uniref:hypothetical protein n=1 Tax=Actinoplanes sp. URMC 104 TaxID=3423409 RepID=UPI003F199FCE